MAKLKTVAQLEQCAEKISQYGVVDKIDGVSVPVLMLKIAQDMQQQFDNLSKIMEVNFVQFCKIQSLEDVIQKNNREISGLIEKLNSQENEIGGKFKIPVGNRGSNKNPTPYGELIIESLRCLGINCEIYMEGSILHAHVKDDYCENFSLKFDVRIKDSIEIQHSIVSAVCDAREDCFSVSEGINPDGTEK